MAQVQMKITPNLSTPPMHQPQLKSSGTVYSGSGMIVGVTVNQPTGAPPMGIGGPPPSIMDQMTLSMEQMTLSNHIPTPGSHPMTVPQIVPEPLQPNNSNVTSAINHHHISGIPITMEHLPTMNMANTKEKTPMCLINELARYNKQIQHQYRLTDESGPAHKKTFTVALRLGEEEYIASGPSIKKAQHAAAALALEKTIFKHPPPKAQGQQLRMGTGLYAYPLIDASYCTGNVTPTVELNALAMKRGEPAVYKIIEPHRHHYVPPNFNFRGMYNQRYHYQRTPQMFYVSLSVGNRAFLGEGRTSQAARHNAAAKALKMLRDLPLPDHANKAVEENKENGPNENLDPDSELKSPIGLVHEIALKRNLSVAFEVVRESGPPHMRTFVTKCIVGDMVTEGEGNGKKVSKKRAAEKMLEELKKLPALPPTIPKVKKKTSTVKKKSRNLIKEQKANPEYGQGINPISRLIQIQQAKKEKEPVYTLVAERGLPRRREFVMQVTVSPHSCTGTGPNKKLAKRAAAEGLLQMLGYSRPQPQPSKPAIKTPGQEGAETDKTRKVTFLDQEVTPKVEKPDTESRGGRQLVPGLILMPDLAMNDGSCLQGFSHGSSGLNRAPGGPLHNNADMMNKVSMRTAATIAKELLTHGISPTAEAILKSGHKPLTSQPVRPKQQLLYLADVLGFAVQFTDFPKGNKTEFLSLVSLSTSPPQVSHGSGPTLDASHDQAALTALKALAELGIDTVTDNKKDVNMAAGDGLHVNGGQKLANSNGPDLGGSKIGASPITTKAVP
uniref:Double-stranded RNA-binding protein Staufen-like protein n=1 Tax=Scolopendra viridis TaxID=118503 RepID=A0A4D5RA94_SCOVI